MSQSNFIAQPSARTTLDALQLILQSGHVEQIDLAVAYITNSGAFDFIKRATGVLGDAWAEVPKRWVTSFDYCRTDPVALNYLNSLPNSTIRIHDADFSLRHCCVPRTPFHPKTFLIQTEQNNFVLAGSGNMSRSGLSLGIEAGLVLSVNRLAPEEPSAVASLSAMQTWFQAAWQDASPLTTQILVNYQKIFERNENLRAPSPTEDDIASTYVGRGSLSTKDLQKLRTCNNFWIDAGNITKNRGADLPGNQLMMKRLARVFFGFSPTKLPENSQIGDVEIKVNGVDCGKFSLTYSDNTMEKLVLPIPGPGLGTFPSYDNKFLLFKRWRPGGFELSLGSNAMKNQWRKKSSAIDGIFKMTSGREWGVF